MAKQDRSYIGKGTIYLKALKAGIGLMPVGNCSALEISFEEDKKEQKDYTSVGGGNVNVVSRIDSVTGSMTALDLSADTMAPALRAAVKNEASGQVTDEVITATGNDGELLPFAYAPDHTQAITVKNAADDSGLTEGDDYTLTANGLLVVGAGAITASGVKVSYTKAPQEILEAMVSAGEEFCLFFDGMNEAQSGNPVSVTLHKVKFSPLQGLQLIGDEFAEVSMEFEVLRDSTKTGTGISQFMKVIQAL
ncbi:hypothetical protein GZ77_21300 [Endozoicomonas montiporae]|uniref:Major tail protein n=2 Tax=Endozoicomonas montiporae TaxID=1027273 RepID=A0A081N3E3_9GAMM|nr:hypothetical protein [Endozoicomonas montiporae]KEQ12966.1 hypothetical protein GZ77_21300 [Endozoicomonas montiporae]